MSLILNGINQYLRREVVLSTTPMAFSCWFKADDGDNSYPLMATDDGNDDIQLLQAAGAVEGNPVRIGSYDAGGWALADTIAGYSASTWYHACGLFSGVASRKVWINGVSAGEDETSKNPTEELYTWVGSYKNAAVVFAGKIAEVAIWNANLTDAEILRLAGGVKPSTIQVSKLTAYWPLLEDANDISGNSKHLTEYNSPSYDAEDHPTMLESEVISTIRHYCNNLMS